MNVTQKINKAEKLYSSGDYQGALTEFNLVLKGKDEIELLDPYYALMFDCHCHLPLSPIDGLVGNKLLLAIKAGERGNAPLSRYVAGKYISGNGCEKDIINGIRWYFTAIGNGDAESCLMMAELFLSENKDAEMGIKTSDRETLGMEINADSAKKLLGMIINDMNENKEVMQKAEKMLSGLKK